MPISKALPSRMTKFLLVWSDAWKLWLRRNVKRTRTEKETLLRSLFVLSMNCPYVTTLFLSVAVLTQPSFFQFWYDKFFKYYANVSFFFWIIALSYHWCVNLFFRITQRFMSSLIARLYRRNLRYLSCFYVWQFSCYHQILHSIWCFIWWLRVTYIYVQMSILNIDSFYHIKGMYWSRWSAISWNLSVYNYHSLYYTEFLLLD